MTVIKIRADWELRNCPECGQALPKHWDWDVRSLAWLHDLPRKISPTNNDLTFHDGANGRNRFLHIELKRDKGQMQTGQQWLLEGLSRLDSYTVLVVRGQLVDDISIQRVFKGDWEDEMETDCEALNTAIRAWYKGQLWRDARAALTAARAVHTCAWEKDADGVFRCRCGEIFDELPW